MKNGAFDYVRSINAHVDIIRTAEDPQATEEAYNPFLTNRSFSYFPDTIFHANEANLNNATAKLLQHDYYQQSIRPSKRYSPWVKKSADEAVDVIQRTYACNYQYAVQLKRALTDEQIDMMKKALAERDG